MTPAQVFYNFFDYINARLDYYDIEFQLNYSYKLPCVLNIYNLKSLYLQNIMYMHYTNRIIVIVYHYQISDLSFYDM